MREGRPAGHAAREALAVGGAAPWGPRDGPRPARGPQPRRPQRTGRTTGRRSGRARAGGPRVFCADKARCRGRGEREGVGARPGVRAGPGRGLGWGVVGGAPAGAPGAAPWGCCAGLARRASGRRRPRGFADRRAGRSAGPGSGRVLPFADSMAAATGAVSRGRESACRCRVNQMPPAEQGGGDRAAQRAFVHQRLLPYLTGEWQHGGTWGVATRPRVGRRGACTAGPAAVWGHEIIRLGQPNAQRISLIFP